MLSSVHRAVNRLSMGFIQSLCVSVFQWKAVPRPEWGAAALWADMVLYFSFPPFPSIPLRIYLFILVAMVSHTWIQSGARCRQALAGSLSPVKLHQHKLQQPTNNYSNQLYRLSFWRGKCIPLGNVFCGSFWVSSDFPIKMKQTEWVFLMSVHWIITVYHVSQKVHTIQ